MTQPAPDTQRIVARANADSWLLVKDRTGAERLNRVLRTGETWPVPARTDLLMTIGNATPALGGNGTVRRDLPLDPDQIWDGWPPPRWHWLHRRVRGSSGSLLDAP